MAAGEADFGRFFLWAGLIIATCRPKSKRRRKKWFFTGTLCLCVWSMILMTGPCPVYAAEAPEETISGNGMPAADGQPGETVPGSGVPADRQPGESTPGNGVPIEDKQPGETVSGNGMSVADKPGETVSDNALPVMDNMEGIVTKNALPMAETEGEAMWQTEQGWVQGSFVEAVSKASPDGTVVLLSDVMLTDGVTISKPVIITSADPAHPRTIKNLAEDKDDKQNYGRIFTVNGGELGLEGVILDGGRKDGITAYHPLICVNGNRAVVRMLEGAVLQNAENRSQSLCGGGINIRTGQCIMHDGSGITHCKARHGGGIEVNGAKAMLGMAGGVIDDCEADNGGGVYVNIGMFQMRGGEIKNCRATKEDAGAMRTGGGGIYIAGEKNVAAVLIGNGRITDNSAVSNGGGILVQGGYTLLQMEGGTLENNTAECGGGVSMVWGTLKLYGGTVTGNTASLYGGGILGSPDSLIELQGNPKVKGNTAGDTADCFDNFYLDGAEDAAPDWATVPIRLTGSLTDGVELGMSRWVCPDDGEHPYRDMIVPGDDYVITQADLDRLCDDRKSPDKELYADNMEKYAFIPYEDDTGGKKIVMILAAGITLDKETMTLTEVGKSGTLTATVTPANALIKDVVWSSSDESVATVDADGVVTAVKDGKALITATTVSPYHEKASCEVTVMTKKEPVSYPIT